MKHTPTPWKMPDWMEPYRGLFNNTGGNTIEELMNADPKESNVIINAPLALICVAVESQVSILHSLKRAGVLIENPKAIKELIDVAMGARDYLETIALASAIPLSHALTEILAKLKEEKQ